MALTAALTALTTTATKRVGCTCHAHMRGSTKGTGSWDQHRVVWDFTAYPAGYTYTTLDPRPGAQLGVTMNLRDGEFEGYCFAFHATHAGTYTVRCTITDSVGVTSSDTHDFVVAAGMSTVTLAAAGGGDYTTWAALHAGEGLDDGGATAVDLKVVVKSGTYDLTGTGEELVDVSNLHIQWDGISTRPIFDVAVFYSFGGAENSTLEGVQVRSAIGTTTTPGMIKYLGANSIGIVNVNIDEWVGGSCISSDGAVAGAGLLILGGTYGHKKSTETEISEFYHGSNLFPDVCMVGVTAGDAVDQTNRLMYLLTSVGLTALACDFKNNSSSGRQCVRFRTVSWAYFHRTKILDGASVQTESTDNACANIRVHACYNKANGGAGGYDRFGIRVAGTATASSIGFYSCVTDSTGGTDNIGAFAASTVAGATIADIGVYSNTWIVGGGSAGNTTICDLQYSVEFDVVGNLFVMTSDFSSDVQFYEDLVAYIGVFDGNVFPIQSGLTAINTNFYEHHLGDTDTLATFNGYADIGTCFEIDESLDSNFVPATGTTITTPPGTHTDYYGNAVGSTMLAGAVQAEPSSLFSSSSLFARSTFLLLGL